MADSAPHEAIAEPNENGAEAVIVVALALEPHIGVEMAPAAAEVQQPQQQPPPPPLAVEPQAGVQPQEPLHEVGEPHPIQPLQPQEFLVEEPPPALRADEQAIVVHDAVIVAATTGRRSLNTPRGSVDRRVSMDELMFEDPISYDIIDEAMITPCGHSFSKVTIEDWLTHNSTCPLCNSELKASSLVPNYSLRDAVARYLAFKKGLPPPAPMIALAMGTAPVPLSAAALAIAPPPNERQVAVNVYLPGPIDPNADQLPQQQPPQQQPNEHRGRFLSHCCDRASESRNGCCCISIRDCCLCTAAKGYHKGCYKVSPSGLFCGYTFGPKGNYVTRSIFAVLFILWLMLFFFLISLEIMVVVVACLVIIVILIGGS